MSHCFLISNGGTVYLDHFLSLLGLCLRPESFLKKLLLLLLSRLLQLGLPLLHLRERPLEAAVTILEPVMGLLEVV